MQSIYYVLVFTKDGPVYVTNVRNLLNISFDTTLKPMQLPRDFAEDVAYELNSNGNKAVVVTSRHVINKHPYN